MRNLAVFFAFAVLAACADRSLSPTVPAALNIGTNKTIFAATSRAQDENGNFGFGRSETLRLLELTVSIPPSHKSGSLQFGYANPKPRTEFAMAKREEIPTYQDFNGRITKSLQKLPRGEREVTVFVHGYNSTQSETAFRAAQIATDLNVPGALVIYSWPTRGKALAYAYDTDSMLFARDGLEELLVQLTNTGADKIVLVAHSMGSALVMEALRQIDIRSPGWPARKLGGVILISPDLDVEVFRSHMNRLSKIPRPFILFISGKDKILNLSSRLRGTHQRERLGNLQDLDQISEYPIEIIDTTAFSSDAGSSHFITATSPALIAIFQGAKSVTQTFGAEGPSLERLIVGSDFEAPEASEIVLEPSEEGAN